MTPQEINEAVARKLGIVPIHMHDPKPGELWGPKKECFCAIPDYCTSIAAAWEVVDFLNKVPKQWVSINVANGHASATIHQWHKHIADEITHLTETADTAPMAIALCFLKLEDK